MSESQAVVPVSKQMARFKDTLNSPAFLAAVSRVLPPHLTADRLVRVALAELSRNPSLRACTTLSVASELQKAAEVGLEVGGTLGSGYLVPFRNKHTGQMEAKFIPGYRGLIDLARRSGEVKKIEARLVWEADELFHVSLGTEPKIEHVPSLEPEDKLGRLIGCYAVATLADGTTQFEFMTDSALESVRSKSRSKDSGPWVTDTLEMKRKTVVRRLVKYLPLSPHRAKDLARALEIDNAVEAGDEGVVVEGAATLDGDATTEAVPAQEPPKPKEPPRTIQEATERLQEADPAPPPRKARGKATPKPEPPVAAGDPEDLCEACYVKGGGHVEDCPNWIPGMPTVSKDTP